MAAQKLVAHFRCMLIVELMAAVDSSSARWSIINIIIITVEVATAATHGGHAI
jgi:hypothetical protein